ncbi:hypothetical protein [Cedratvirus kamchatka]|uniref:Uncharacterized protein n=1 Tax=Cedratvirus kamchatka TaxID=2716914 RepID=A0A6G8MYE5_9VIRU|nr:hypothetical protein [Cedratvirus kamchatka]WIL04386.1 hypothetical protein Clen_456 [Cedratvirus lena]WIL04976.1 hypothetical protein Cduv_496 [Cedratvirus duvanny]
MGNCCFSSGKDLLVRCNCGRKARYRCKVSSKYFYALDDLYNEHAYLEDFWRVYINDKHRRENRFVACKYCIGDNQDVFTYHPQGWKERNYDSCSYEHASL